MGNGYVGELQTEREDSETNNTDIAFNSMRVGSVNPAEEIGPFADRRSMVSF